MTTADSRLVRTAPVEPITERDIDRIVTAVTEAGVVGRSR